MRHSGRVEWCRYTKTMAVFIFGFVLSFAAFGSDTGVVPGHHPLNYQGAVTDQWGEPLDGSADMSFRFLDTLTGEEVLIENHSNVRITGGVFEVPFGCGTILDGWGMGTYTSLGQILADYPDLWIQVEIGGRVHKPLIRLASAGHSPKSRYDKWLQAQDGDTPPMVLSGPVRIGGGEDPREPLASKWKGWETQAMTTSIQAVSLEPDADGNGAARALAAGVSTPAPPFVKGPMLAEVIGPVLSLPVRDLPDAEKYEFYLEEDEDEINPPRHGNLYDEYGQLFGTMTEKVEDPLLMLSEGFRSPDRTPSILADWEGIPKGPYTPPDTEGDVGPNHYIQVVNVQFKIWDKSGNVLKNATNTNMLWSGFGGPCQSNNSGDAILFYDRHADRWVISQFAISGAQAVCFAVSQTPDPLGAFYLYQVNTQRFPDYYKLGAWPDDDNNAYFIGTNSKRGEADANTQ